MARPADLIVPRRLGPSFRWLLAAAIVNNFGDGVVLAAGPLLVASQTSDPFLVSLAVLSGFLPTLLFGVLGGTAADRFDRRRMVIVVNLIRAGALAVLVVTILSGSVNIAIILITLFILGSAETFADSASSTFLPNLVAREDLGLANARMQGAFLLTNQLVAPPIGAFLFATGMAIPFATNAVGFVLGALLVSRVVLSSGARSGSGRACAGDAGRHRLADGAPADAHARAYDLPVQCHVRGGLVGAGPLRQPAARHGSRRDSGSSRRRLPSAASSGPSCTVGSSGGSRSRT